MTKPDLVLDLSAEGLSLWQTAEAKDWTLLGFTALDDPALSANLASMRAAAAATAGEGFATMLLLPDDHIWVQRLHLRGRTPSAKDADARLALAAATALPQSGFSIAYGTTDATGATAIAATTTEVLAEARKFAQDTGFNPQVLASRSFFDGFTDRVIFEDAPKPLAFLPKNTPPAKPAAAPKPAFVMPSLPKMPSIPRKWLLGGAGAVLATAAFTYWLIDPYEQFLRPPFAQPEVAAFALPGDPATEPALAFAASEYAPLGKPAALPSLAADQLALAGLADAPQQGDTQIAIAFDPAGVFFAAPPTPPQVPAGIGATLARSTPAAMFLDTPDSEPVIGIAALQKLPDLAFAGEVPATSGQTEAAALAPVIARAGESLGPTDSDPGLGTPESPADNFAYRGAETSLTGLVPAAFSASNEGFDSAPVLQPGLASGIEVAALTMPLAMSPLLDTLIPSPPQADPVPGGRPMPRPASFDLISPSEAEAALAPAETAESLPFFGPEWNGPVATTATLPAIAQSLPYFGPPWTGPVVAPAEPEWTVTEYVAGRPGHVRPQPRPQSGEAEVAATPGLPEGVIEYVEGVTGQVRPQPRSPAFVARVAAIAADESLVALNLTPEATLDVGLGWQEYNPDNPDHVRPKTRPASLQELALKGDLTPTALAIKTSGRPEPRPSNIETIILARQEEIKAAVVAAAEAEARAQSVAAAAALVQSQQAETESTGSTDPDLAALDDAEPETTTELASLPTNANVAETATIANAINRSEITLIGIYGTETKRRALVRLPSGRYERVTVGDSFSGWKVAAIGRDAIQIVKGGQTEVLKMPD